MNLSTIADGLVGQPMFQMRSLITSDVLRFEIGDSSSPTDQRISEYTGQPRLEREESPWEKGINYNVG